MAGSRVLSADTIQHFAKVGVEGSNPFARSSFQPSAGNLSRLWPGGTVRVGRLVAACPITMCLPNFWAAASLAGRLSRAPL